MTWKEHYEIARQYYEEHGNLNVPCRTKLYTWISAQKYTKRGKRGHLTDDQILLLEEIGIVWESDRDYKWRWYFEHAQTYFEMHGALNVPISYVSEDGCKLGQWITRQRRAYKYKCNGGKEMKHKPFISDDEIRMLESIGMQWDITWLGRRTSIPEIMVYYYISQYYPDTIKLTSGDFLHVEIDIYIPSIKLGIEYDGYEWHKDKREQDEYKGAICEKHDIKLIRIREKGLAPICKCECNYFVESDNHKELQKVIEEILCM